MGSQGKWIGLTPLLAEADYRDLGLRPADDLRL